MTCALSIRRLVRTGAWMLVGLGAIPATVALGADDSFASCPSGSVGVAMADAPENEVVHRGTAAYWAFASDPQIPEAGNYPMVHSRLRVVGLTVPAESRGQPTFLVCFRI